MGGWYCIHRQDLQRLAPLWLQLTKEVRKNPQRYWHMESVPHSVPRDLDTGDAYARRGHPPFIADLYGWAFAAAEVGLEHVIHRCRQSHDRACKGSNCRAGRQFMKGVGEQLSVWL